MANEAVCIEAPKTIKRFTIVDGIAIPKGTILKLSGQVVNQACASAAADAVAPGAFAGITVEEKTVSDGITQVGAAIDGVWDMYMGSNTIVNMGTLVSLSGANIIKQALTVEILSGCIIGKALEPGAAESTIRVLVGGNY